jgi:hypothetical protein
MLKFAFEVQFSQCCHQRFAALRSGDEPRPSLYKYKQNFKLKTFPISDKSRATPFLETAVSSSVID